MTLKCSCKTYNINLIFYQSYHHYYFLYYFQHYFIFIIFLFSISYLLFLILIKFLKFRLETSIKLKIKTNLNVHINMHLMYIFSRFFLFLEMNDHFQKLHVHFYQNIFVFIVFCLKFEGMTDK